MSVFTMRKMSVGATVSYGLLGMPETVCLKMTDDAIQDLVAKNLTKVNEQAIADVTVTHVMLQKLQQMQAEHDPTEVVQKDSPLWTMRNELEKHYKEKLNQAFEKYGACIPSLEFVKQMLKDGRNKNKENYREKVWKEYKLLGWGGFGVVLGDEKTVVKYELLTQKHLEKIKKRGRMVEQEAIFAKILHDATKNTKNTCFRSLDVFACGLRGDVLVTIFEKGGGCLQSWIKSKNGQSPEAVEKDVQDILTGLLSQLSVVWSLGIVHKDIKPQNILVSEVNGQCCVQLIDFGMAEWVLARKFGLVRGTVKYIAPEMFSSYGCAHSRFRNLRGPWRPDRRALDMYSLAPLAFRFSQAEGVDKLKAIKKAKYAKGAGHIWMENPDNLKLLPECYRRLVKAALTLDPPERELMVTTEITKWLSSKKGD